jgi:hypothetical protein
MSAAAVTLPPPPPPPAVARRSRSTVLALFAGALVGAIALAVILTMLNSSDTQVEDTCLYPDPCGPPTAAAELVSLTPWDSPLGFGFRYDTNVWTLGEQDDHSVTLRLADRDDAVLRVVGSTGTTPEAAIDAYVADLRTRVPDLAEDGRAFRLVLGAAVGYQDGAGASYSGHVQAPQGPGPIVTMSIMAGTVGNVTVVASMEMTGEQWIQLHDGTWDGESVFQVADSVINTVRWTS